MRDRALKKFAADFRAGILDGRDSFLMCAAVCLPLHTLLGLSGVETEIVEANFPEVNHMWLCLKDGRILDPTADQFGLSPVYLGPLPLTYEARQARLAVLGDCPQERE